MQSPSPIKCATALSLMLHAALLVSFGVSHFLQPADIDSVPTMQFTLDVEDGRDLDKDNAPRTTRLIQLGPTNTRPAVSIADNRPSEVDPDNDTGKSEPPPPESSDASGTSDSTPQETLVADAAETELSEILTTTGESDFSAPASASTEQPVSATDTIAPNQQRAMTRKVLRWAQGMRETKDSPSQLTWRQDGRAYSAVLKRRPAVTNTDIESAIVEIVTLEGGKELRTRLHLKRLAFSHYTQLVDRWDTTVQLHDDEVNGRFHSNSEITLGYDRAVAPRFLGKVTTAAGSFALANWSGVRPRAEIFPAGFEIRAGRISLPQRFLRVDSHPELANAQYHTFERDTRITFYADGTYGWQPLANGAHEERASLGRVPMLMVASRGAELRVSGTVNGNVLVYSPERIWIDGNVTYAHDAHHMQDAPDTPEAPGARSSQDSTNQQDYLGLASDQFIDIARPEVTGPGDLEIDAAIYARRHFTVTDETTPGHGATLNIFGSLTAGALSATEPRYATRLEFDPRFEHTRPPGFPMTDRYEVDEWDAHWHAPDDSPN